MRIKFYFFHNNIIIIITNFRGKLFEHRLLVIKNFVKLFGHREQLYYDQRSRVTTLKEDLEANQSKDQEHLETYPFSLGTESHTTQVIILQYIINK